MLPSYGTSHYPLFAVIVFEAFVVAVQRFILHGSSFHREGRKIVIALKCGRYNRQIVIPGIVSGFNCISHQELLLALLDSDSSECDKFK